ncbi:uncharacterized protein LOC134822278 isoform X3 [Bolinopsis microptera]|uniref:uncharacterized protein LOC134822278 isoform X3 n=1 Tax=Bolinopsis microptera TaxID=2820187 RepID=UPI003079C2CD
MVVQTPDQLFDCFVAAKNQEDVFEYFNEIKQHVLQECGSDLSSTRSINLYHKLKQSLRSWRAQSIWKILDERVDHVVYQGNVLSEGRRTLVIGAGPIGLRMAIECAFLGGETHVIEKRSSATRNNILHLWPFTIDDLRRLGAKKFYGQFCAGAIDHISIRQLQLILLKICCLLGVQIHVGVEFRGVEEPTIDKSGNCTGWGIHVVPHPPLLPKWRWDAMVQASGRQHVLPLFQYKEFRGQQAIGMTVNFVNRSTMEELTIEEISGIAFIYNQEFFNEMYAELGISLENIVYYKDETHYFVMSTKKHSLLDKKVLKKDYSTTSELLSPDNIDYVRAQTFAREVAGFATNLPVLEFKKNHHGKADIAIFDFSAIKQAANSTLVLERKGHKLVMSLVGDSLLEPFWPQGTGCARGFLSVANTAWMLKKVFQGVQTYEVLQERESLFKLLAQTTPMQLDSKYDKYTIDPNTRYKHWAVSAEQFEVFHLYNREDTPIVNSYQGSTVAVNTRTPSDVRSKRRTREDRRKTIQVTVNRSYSKEAEEREANSPTTPTLEQGSLLNWARESTCGYRGVRVTNLTTTWKSGLAFSALIHRYRPDLLNFTAVSTKCPEVILKTVFDTTSREFGIRSLFTAKELASTSIPDRQKIVQYLAALHCHFTSEATKSLQISPDMCYFCSRHITPEQLTSSHGIKFHSSCLKCEHCLDKISTSSLNSLHYVDEKMAGEFAQRRKPGYPDCKSGFYCKFHFKEYFASKSDSLYPKNWLENKELELISSSTDPLSSTTEPQPHSDSEEPVVPRDHSHELRRAKSAASVRNLRDMFESISTGTSQSDLVPVNKEEEEEEEKTKEKLPNGHLTLASKSKSFSGALPIRRDDQIEDNRNGVLSPTICSKPKNGKKKKSGIAKKIERRMGSVRSSKANSNKTESDVLIGPGVDQSLLSDSFVINHKKKSRFKLFKKKKMSGSNPPSPLLTSASESNLDETASLIITNKPEPLTEAESLSLRQPVPGKDPLYTIANPEYKAESDSLSDTTSTSSFVRNSLTRRTCPPNMHKSMMDSTAEDLVVDSNSCRRVPSKVIQNLSREAVVLQTNSPEARSLLRNSFRNSKRGSIAGSIKQSLDFEEDDVSMPGTPKSSKVQISRASSQQALVNPSADVPVSEAHVISKAFYSPKPKRAQKVKLDSVEMMDVPGTNLVASEATVVHRTSCSPLPQRSKKVRLSMCRRSPLNMSLEFSSDDEETPPRRPELPRNLDLILSAKPKPSLENGYKKDVIETDSVPILPLQKVSSASSVSAPSISCVIPSQSDDLNTDNLALSLKSDGSEGNSKSQLLSNSLTISESSYSSSADVFETKAGSNYYRTFMYAKRIAVDPQQKRASLGQSFDSSEYHTPGTHRSTLTSPSEETFHTPNGSFENHRRVSAPSMSVPAKRPSDTVDNCSSKRSSIELEDIADKVSENIEEMFKATARLSSVPRTSEDEPSLQTPTKSVPVEKLTTRKSEPVLSNKANRVLNENMSPKDHSSINKILEKYRRIPTSPTSETTKSRTVQSMRDKPKRSISERQAKLSANAERRSSSSANPHQRVKVIHQLSNSFDKTIDRLVNKYYPKRDSSRNSPRSEVSKEVDLNRSLSTPTKDAPSKDKKTPASATKDVQRCTSMESPRRATNYEDVKRHPSTPSRYYSYKSRSSTSADDKSGDNEPTPQNRIKKSALHSGMRSRESSGSSSTFSRDSTKQTKVEKMDIANINESKKEVFLPKTEASTPKTEAPTPKNEALPPRTEALPPRTPTRSTPNTRGSVTRETSLNSPSKGNNKNTPIKGTPKPRSAPLRSASTHGSFRSFNADKLRYTDSRRAQSQNTVPCDCRTAVHAPTCKRVRGAGEKNEHEGKEKDDLENIAYIELSDTERLKHWGKTDYSKYLKSLRYQGSTITRSSSFNVKDTVKAERN